MARNCATARASSACASAISILSVRLAHRVLGALLRGQRRGLVQIARARRRVGEHGDEMRLHFERAAADVERLLFLAFRLHAHFAGLQRGQQRRVTRRDAELALRARREHHARLAREDLSFGADDVDVNGVGHDCALKPSVLAFSTASSMAPIM